MENRGEEKTEDVNSSTHGSHPQTERERGQGSTHPTPQVAVQDRNEQEEQAMFEAQLRSVVMTFQKLVENPRFANTYLNPVQHVLPPAEGEIQLTASRKGKEKVGHPEVPMFLKNMMKGGGMGGGSEDVKVSLVISFRDAVEGCEKSVNFQTDTRCDACSGTGTPPGALPQVCSACKGTGMSVQSPSPGFMFQTTCGRCGGSGHFVNEKCATCGGKGSVRTKKTVMVIVPAGVDSENTIRVPEEGGFSPSGRTGDVFVTLKVLADPVFKREKTNIHVDAPISFATAILGGKVQVPTLFGDVVLKVRPGTQPGHKEVLRGKGIKALNSSLRGDQYVHLLVNIPTSLSQHQRSLIEEYQKEENKETSDDNRAAAGGRL
ncbi:hypothetical protein L7F22_035754 [Adiantum nelumboides]|nr:hypothetical protein [Adiantum nelumboides]